MFFSSNRKEKDYAVFSGAAIYVRKWISEAFVGVFSSHLLLLVWDYIFMANWRSNCLKNVAYLTLALIRPWAMMAKGPRWGTKEVKVGKSQKHEYAKLDPYQSAVAF